MKFATILLSALIGAVAATPVVQPDTNTVMKLALRAPVAPINGRIVVRQMQARQADTGTGCPAAPPSGQLRTDMKRNIPQAQARRNGQAVVPRQNTARGVNPGVPAKAPIRRPRADQPRRFAGAAAGSKKRTLDVKEECKWKTGEGCPED